MERYRYYDKGRYFAVTNKFPAQPGEYEMAGDDFEYLERPAEGGYDGDEGGDQEAIEQINYEKEGLIYEPKTEPYDMKEAKDDNDIAIDENKNRFRSYDNEKEKYNEPKGVDPGDPGRSYYDTDANQMRYDQEYEIPRDEEDKNDNIKNERNRHFYDDRGDDLKKEDRGIENEKERYDDGRSDRMDEVMPRFETYDEKESYKYIKPTDRNVDYEKFKNNKDIRTNIDDDRVNSPRSEKIENARGYPEKEYYEPRKERQFILHGRYYNEPSKQDKPDIQEYEEPQQDDTKEEITNDEFRNEYGNGVEAYEKPKTERKFDDEFPTYDRSYDQSPKQNEQSNGVGSHYYSTKDRDFMKKYPPYERHYDEKPERLDENTNIRDYKEPRREGKFENTLSMFKKYENEKPRICEDRGGVVEKKYEQRDDEIEKKYAPVEERFPQYERYEVEPIQQQPGNMKDFMEQRISPEVYNVDEKSPISGYYENEDDGFEIDVDDIEPYREEMNENETGEEDLKLANEEIVEEDVIHEEFCEIESEPIDMEVLEQNDFDQNEESDWPAPPEERLNGNQEEDDIDHYYGKKEEYFDEQMTKNVTREDHSLYTSFLTIDVAPTKRDNLDAPTLAESKHRSSLLNLVTGSHELEQMEESVEIDKVEIDKDDMDKIRHDIEMISKYLHSMPLGASFWPQNYDVLRDLVKLYLASKSTSSAALNYLLGYFLKLDWPELFLKCARRIMKNYPQVFVHSSDHKIPFEDPTPETLDMTQMSLEYAVAVIFQVILSLAAEFTEVHEQSKNVGFKGFIKFIFQELLPKLHGIPWGQSTAREEFLHSSIDILYNYSQSASNFACFYECDAVDVIINLRRETDYIGGNRVNIGALLTLSFFVDDRNNHRIFIDSAPISLLIHYIEESLSKIDHCYADFSLSELIDGLTRIASHDQNKLIICSHGGLNAISKVLRKSQNEEELIAVCRLVWCLCFVEKCKQKMIKKSPEIIKTLRDLQKSKNATLQQLAESLVWEFEEKYSDLSQSAKLDVQHIFISYHAENRDTILRISDRLKDKGYKVWLEKSKGESYSRHLMEAIENAAIVLIAISRKYKQAPSIFAEADYAFKLCKPMIPLTLERNYKPDGWLGMLAGSKVWLDFTEESKFEGHMQMLMRQIGDKGKSERSPKTINVNEKQKAETIRDTVEDRLIDISRWGNEEVIEWLQQNNLKSCVADEKLHRLRGPHLLRLHHLRRESPEFYYNSLEPQLGFTDVIDMMEFTQALESLTELQ